MNYELEINKLKTQLQNLQDVVLNMARNSVPTTSKVDDTANKVEQITPYTETKTAYIGDTELVFNNVPQGNVLVYTEMTIPLVYDRMFDSVVVHFDEPLEEVTEVTISIQ